MTARNFLVRGLVAGLVAGLLTFAVAYFFGEPSVDAAIAIEEAASAAVPEEAHEHAEAVGTEVSRTAQATWGLLTATLAVGVALGGVVSLAAAAALGRIGRLSPGQSTALVSLLGFVSVSLVPFLKYPSTPPAVGNPDTIGERTTYYFVFMLVSVAAATAAVVLARYLLTRLRVVEAVTIATVAYLLVVVVVGQVMPTVNEIGEFPGDILWYFRRGSIVTVATMWGAIGVVLTALVGRLFEQSLPSAQRREVVAGV